jgi:hypothetical protein
MSIIYILIKLYNCSPRNNILTCFEVTGHRHVSMDTIRYLLRIRILAITNQ